MISHRHIIRFGRRCLSGCLSFPGAGEDNLGTNGIVPTHNLNVRNAFQGSRACYRSIPCRSIAATCSMVFTSTSMTSLFKLISRNPDPSRRRFTARVLQIAISSFFSRHVLAEVSEFGSPYRVNVRDHGAHGDGRTLDTVAFERAIDDCVRKGGGSIEVPAGSYVIGTVLLTLLHSKTNPDTILFHFFAGTISSLDAAYATVVTARDPTSATHPFGLLQFHCNQGKGHQEASLYVSSQFVRDDRNGRICAVLRRGSEHVRQSALSANVSRQQGSPVRAG